VTTRWLDRVKVCVGWEPVDRARIADLRRCVGSDCTEVIEALGQRLAQFKDAQRLMANTRFVQRLYGVLREWLMGLLDGSFDEEHVRARWEFVRRLVEVGLSFEDLILLEGLARGMVFDLSQGWLDECPQALWPTIYTLDKALCLDMALIHDIYFQMREAEIESATLDRFLEITGFSRTLYENLAETREWSEVDLGRTGLP